MKTLSEHEAERIEHARTAGDARHKAYEERILAANGIVLAPGITEALREALRASVVTNGALWLRLACDRCGTELCNYAPGDVILTSPPRIRVGCVGCGMRTAMVAA